jgi:putative DNA primase/helicase
MNLGQLNGEPSGDRVDVDLDAPEAVALADAFLPATGAIFGRASKPQSHRIYITTIATQKFTDLGKRDDDETAMVVELRATGTQTVIPPSVHPSGESIEWAADGAPARVDPAELRRAVAHLACAAMLARHWPGVGCRHEAALAAAGFLLRAGVEDEAAVKIVTGAARTAGDPEWGDRKRAALDTVGSFRAGGAVTGGPTLGELLVADGEKVVRRLRKWLGVEERRESPHHLTDLGNGGRLVIQAAGDLRYAYSQRSWFAWTGARWQRDAGDAVMTRAKQMVRGIYTEAAAETDPGARPAIAKWARKSEHEARLRAAIFLAQSEPGIPLTMKSLDADPWLLNVLNGSINLRTGELRPHRREDYCTKLAPVAYAPDATGPRFMTFMEQIFAGNNRLIRFMQKAIGYALTGDTSEQCFFLLWGGGANGKTTLLKVLASILGDYAIATRAETFMVKGPDSIPNDVARLRGARWVTAVEADSGERLAEALVKQMTGGDVMTARFMRAEFFDFVPAFKIFIGTNHKPVIRGTDYAMWRRVRLIPFTVTIPPEDQDKHLEAKLRAERAGILRWALEGCLLWQREGLGLPEEVRVATSAYQAEMDVLGQFIAERCVLEAEARITSGELYASYTSWSEQGGERPMSKRTFGLRVTERGVEAGRTEAARGWRGIRLRTAADPDPGPGRHDASPQVTHHDASSLIDSHDARAIGSSGKLRQLRHSPGDASSGQRAGDEGEV